MANDPLDLPDPDDPLLQIRIDRAVKPYEGRLSPEALAECRRMLAVLLMSHPVAAPLMDRVRADLAAHGSGTVARRDPAVLARAVGKKAAKKGG